MASKSKVRLVVGLIGTAAELDSALAELRSQGLGPARIQVVAQPDAFDGALARRWESGGAAGSWIVCRPAGGGGEPWAMALAGSGSGSGFDHGAEPPADLKVARALLGFHNGPLQRHARQLHLCLEQGGALLLVQPDTEAEERAACTALLRHAAGGIQTHEIAGAGKP